MLCSNDARQGFYTSSGMRKGCAIMWFYNHSSEMFSSDEIDRITACATTHFSEIPWFLLPDGNIPRPMYVWVEITDDFLDIGAALVGEQTRIDYYRFDDKDGYDGSPGSICSVLGRYAECWMQKRPSEVIAK